MVPTNPLQTEIESSEYLVGEPLATDFSPGAGEDRQMNGWYMLARIEQGQTLVLVWWVNLDCFVQKSCQIQRGCLVDHQRKPQSESMWIDSATIGHFHVYLLYLVRWLYG